MIKLNFIDIFILKISDLTHYIEIDDVVMIAILVVTIGAEIRDRLTKPVEKKDESKKD